MEGQIVKIIRQTHIVNCDNENYACHCRGKIRNKNIVPLVVITAYSQKKIKLLKKSFLEKTSLKDHQ